MGGSEGGLRARDARDAMATGAWLGGAQVALGFAALAVVGSTATTFFATTTAWLLGGVLGARGVRDGRAAAALPTGALVGGALARALAVPFGVVALGATVASAALAGAFGGAYVASRGAATGDARGVLFHENNGFVAGVAAGGLALLVAPRALDAAVALGALALAWRTARRGAP